MTSHWQTAKSGCGCQQRTGVHGVSDDNIGPLWPLLLHLAGFGLGSFCSSVLILDKVRQEEGTHLWRLTQSDVKDHNAKCWSIKEINAWGIRGYLEQQWFKNVLLSGWHLSGFERRSNFGHTGKGTPHRGNWKGSYREVKCAGKNTDLGAGKTGLEAQLHHLHQSDLEKAPQHQLSFSSSVKWKE